MGIFISNMKNCSIPQANPLLNNSISKLREYHGSFKSVCDTFSIDLTEYEQIFGSNETMFQIWDTDNNGLINALELFSGLIIFAESKFEEKARFLFDLFDFNELNSLSLIDLEFLILSCANATYKILQISAEVNEEEISSFLKNSFTDEQRINISQLLKWCIKTSEISEFFQLIRKESPELKNQVQNSLEQKKIEQLKLLFSKDFGRKLLLPDDSRIFFDYKPLSVLVNSKSYITKVEWISSLVKKVFNQQQNSETYEKDIQVRMNWVYGFRGRDVRRPLSYIKVNTGNQERAQNEKIVFFSACVVVIYYPKLNQQRHYLEHDNEIISLGVATNLSLIATGEYAERPAIHIWDSNTLQNLGVINGVHQKGVHLVQFFNRDELVASCGLRANSPVLVHSIKDFTLVLSTMVNEFALDLLVIKNYVGSFEKSQPMKQKGEIQPFDDFESSFVVCTLRQILLFQYFKGHFLTKEIIFDMYDIPTSALVCATSYRINTKNPYLKAYQEETVRSVVVLSGHQNGKVYLWENFETYIEVLSYNDAIVCITTYDNGVIVGTDASTIHFLDFTFKNNIKNMDLTQFGFKLFSYCINDIVSAGDKIIVCTTEGDVVEIYLQTKQQHQSSSYVSKVKSNRINYITQLTGQLNALCILERPESDDKLVFTAGQASVITGFSHETHEIVDVWSVGDQITAMDCTTFEDGGTVFALGTINGRIYLRIDWEESPKWYDCKQQVNDLKFAGDSSCLVCSSNDAFVYIFFLNNNSYFQLTPKKIHFEGEIPLSIDFVDDCKSFIVGTSMRNQYKIELPDLKSKNLLQDNEKLNSTIWSLRYPMVQKEDKIKKEISFPLVLGADVKVFLAAGESGYIYFWRDKEQIENNCGGFLKGHASNVSRLMMSKSQDVFYSVGLSDNTLIEWKVDFINDAGDFSKPFSYIRTPDSQSIIQNQANNAPALSSLSKFSLSVQQQPTLIQIDEIFKREKDYCYFLNNITDRLKDNFLLFRATNQKMLNNLLQDQVQPFDQKNHLLKRAPPISLQLDYVYGFLSFDKRRTLFYVHMYSTQNKKKKIPQGKQQVQKLESETRKKLEKLNQQSVMLPANFQKEMLFAKQTLLNYDDQHTDCQRQFVYITSRVAVVYNPLTNQQRFYEGHRFKITAIAVHPMKCFVATAESAQRPCIHIWNVYNMEPLKILRTNHKHGIYDLVFSRDSSLIVSIGIDEFHSIQVTNWKSEAILGYRNTGTIPISAVTFNPYRKYEFATGGWQNTTIWDVEGRNLSRKNVIPIPSTVTCLSYISYLLGDVIESDIIVGTNAGDLGLIACGKFIVVKEHAHGKMINCLKITEILGDKVAIITSGEDDFVRVWDTKFNVINEFNMRKTGFFEGSAAARNISVQSIDVFSCRLPKRGGTTFKEDQTQEQQNLSVLLLGTRNGDIIEGAFQGEFTGLKINSEDEVSDEEEENSGKENEPEKQTYSIQDSLRFNFSIYIRSHQSQVYDSKQQIDFFNKKLFYTLHPTLPILISAGEDQKLMIWDTENNSVLMVRNLGMTPSAIKFSPDGELLVIGFQGSMVMVLDSKIQRKQLGKVTERYQLPSLDTLISIKDKDNKSAVLNIEFSGKGEMLAISYDNSKSQKDMFDSKLEKEGSFISVFTSRAQQKSTKFRTTEKNLYVKYTDIRCPSIYGSYNTDTEAFGVSVYFMTFCEEGNYLLIYYQLVNIQQTRINNDPQGVYVVWDLKSNTSAKNWDSIKNIKWRHYNFPNSLNSQYQFLENILSSDIGYNQLYQDSLANQIMKTPIMSSMIDIPQYLICGSTNGDLHLVKESCLFYDKDFVNEISKKQMCLAKTYPSHISFVNQVERQNDFIFTSGVLDECIFKWQLKIEQQFWDLDNIDYKKNQSDLFADLVSKDKFKTLYNEILPLRASMAEKLRNVDDTRYPEVELKLQNIIGRKANTRRNNLFYDFDERLLYLAGCNLVITTLEDDDETNFNNEEHIFQQFKKFKGGQNEQTSKVHQEFIKLDQSQDSCSPEISCITLSQDKKLICAGTVETKAKLLFWDINSRTSIRQLTLNNVSIILNVKFAHDNRHICCNAITNEYTMMIYLIDSETPLILGTTNFSYTLPFKIKDLEFHPNSVFRFVTCGIQHMAQWKYCGGYLTHSAMEIENPKDLVLLQQQDNKHLDDQQDDKEENKEEQEDKDTLNITFLSVIFVQDAIITSGEDGYLYVWDDKRVTKKQKAHPDAPILCLNTTKDSQMFVSGGSDGRIILWYLGLSEYTYIVEKIYEYSINNDSSIDSTKNPKFQIQSVCIGSKYILAGTRAGDIYELVRPNEQDLKSLTKVNKEMVKLRLNCTDHERTKVVAFSGNGEKLYTMTVKGLFQVWDISTLKRLYWKHFSKETQYMIVCKLSPKIFIAFEQEVIVLNAFKDTYTVNPEFTLKQKTIISDMKLSYDEKMLAVALKRNPEQNAKFEIYDAASEDNNFKLLFSIDNLNATIEYLDFSTDNFYVLYKDEADDIAMIDLSQYKHINTLYVEFDIEWCSDGIKLSEKAKGVHSSYTDENRILRITPIGEKSIAVTDEMGSIRIFSYPCPSGQGYMRIYTDHLNYINQCVASPDRETLVTTSETDRCIMIWKVFKTEYTDSQGIQQSIIQ